MEPAREQLMARTRDRNVDARLPPPKTLKLLGCTARSCPMDVGEWRTRSARMCNHLCRSASSASCLAVARRTVTSRVSSGTFLASHLLPTETVHLFAS